MVKRIQYIALIFILLLLGGVANKAWAGYKVTYHILTLPMDHTKGTANTNASYDDWRTEAIKVVVANASTIQLEAHFKSPLAKNFTYYPESVITKDATARQIYQYRYNNKYYLFKAPLAPYVKVTVSGHSITNEEVSNATAWGGADSDHKKTATSYADMEETQVTSLADGTYYFSFQDVCLTEGDPIPSNDYHVYVTYEYDANNTIAKLDGTEAYNIFIDNKFLAYNRGRNNRVAGIPSANVSGEQLASDNFVYVNVSDVNTLKDKTYWSSTDNKNPIEVTKSKFHFLFKYIGEDPYNVTIVSAYNSEEAKYYIEKYGSETQFVKKWYEGSSLFAKTTDEMIIGSDENRKYTQTDWDNPSSEVTFDASDAYRGYYHGILQKEVIWNSFALLFADNGSGGVVSGKLVFMGSRTVKSDGSLDVPSGQFYYLGFDNPATVKLKKFAKASAPAADEQMYEVYTYTFKVKTPFGNVISVDKKWSEAYGDQNLTDYIPDALKRKYTHFTGAYKTEALDDIANNELTSFADADANATRDDDKRVIWLKYETTQAWSDLLKTLPVDKDFTDARWYTMRMNAQNQYVVHLDNTSGNFYTGGGSNDADKVHQGENSLEAQVAFMGDPFELRIISHKASHDASNANRYIGCPSSTVTETGFTAVTSSDICSWEIIADETNGSFKLRQYGTYDDPWYFGWNYGASNNPIIYTKGSASSIKVVEMAQKTYVYHIYNSNNEIAVKASASQDVGKPLNYNNIPEIIRSPLIQPGMATLTFYSDAARTNTITHAPFNATADANNDIYVKYTLTGAMPTGSYNVRLNIKYIYYDSSKEGISWSDEAVTDNANPLKDCYIWYLDIADPYAMKVSNTGRSSGGQTMHYVKVDGDWANKVGLTWDTEDNASKFIVKSNGSTNYEVMAATGDGVDASTTYYNIGRTDEEGVLMYSNSSYSHTSEKIRFVLTPLDAKSVDFHLIDKENKELLVVRRRTNDLRFPDQYSSPLVSTYHYFATKDNAIAGTSAINNLDDAADPNSDGVKDVYVTYDTNSLVNLRKGQLYLLKFHAGDTFRQEDGSDDLIDAPGKQAVYPYCNGDCNFFIYGTDEYELQQHGAASTRTRWAWYVESATNDPYHVKICSRQLETYNDNDHQAYFYTSVQNFKYPDEAEASDHVVTSLAWPGITGVRATEYMVLGTVTDETRNFQLVTTPVDNNSDGDCLDEGEHPFYVVNSFEQYWKTFDTIKNKLLTKAGILLPEDEGTNPEGETKVPTDPASYREILIGTYGFHSYDYYAYAKRFNGYNVSGETKKGWEKIEHWYQTVHMGEGFFDFEATVISPVLILLDQHGWEVMRKPLPYSDQDPDKEAKKNVLRTYDSPMVKEYAFWSTAKKRSGLHQYYQLDNRIGGSDYTSTSLGDLPTWGSENVLDAKGNQNDEYVTYIVKDEYAQTYDPTTKTGSKFLIQQGNRFASASDASTITKNGDNTNAENHEQDVDFTGNMSQYIIDNMPISNDKLWILKPNADIDNEQGYLDVKHDWGSNPNAYQETAYKDLKTATYINDKTLGKFSFSNGFDPYNIQISSAQYTDSYFITNATGATLTEGDGAVLGTYSEDPTLALGAKPAIVNGTWYDSRKLSITNATFMAVQDADGNMQLMPRFDQAHRVRNFGDLVTPTAEAGDPTKLPETHTKLFRPMVYNYHIIDNAGFESLRYQSGGDLTPQTPDHFKSPLAKEFKYYKTLTSTGTNTYNLSTLADEITESESFIGKGLTSTAAEGNDVYVRYAYDDEADVDLILKGKWFTMKLNNKDAILNSGIKQGTSKPASVGYDEVEEDVDSDGVDDDEAEKVWQWKFLENPLSNPDPYAVCMYNRSAPDVLQPAANTPRYALLLHSGYSDENRVYALAVTGSGNYTYTFLNGSGMTTSDAASLSVESGFKSTSCSLSEGSQVKLIDDVQHLYKYRVYTNANEFAVEASQTMSDASDSDFKPVLPNSAKTPMLNDEDFRYYYNNNVWSPKISVTDAMKLQFPELENVTEIPDTIGKNLQYMYGLYDDVVYVHYMPYNPDNSSFLVPNDKTLESGHAARGSRSNDAPLGLDGYLLYNIVWYDDNMMYDDNDVLRVVSGQPLQAQPKTYVWQLEGDDPYAIKIKKYNENPAVTDKYVNSTGLSTTAQTFMLLPQDGYEYGVLAVTGTKADKLNYDDETHTVSVATTDTPTQYVIFALATNTVVYHLMIATTNNPIVIPYRGPLTSDVLDDEFALPIKGSTQRDLTSVNSEGGIPGEKFALGEVLMDSLYCKEVGPISLGDKLAVPEVLYRPNVVYEYYVQGIYAPAGATPAEEEAMATVLTALNNKYKGTLMEYMGDDPDLVGKRVFVNVVYSFNGTLKTNAGSDFVRSVADNKWYTFEAKKADGTPQLMQFTNAWGMEVKEGRGTHYTNDYLWTPLGDPYGFKMYHRYTCVNSGNMNSGEPNRVMTSAGFSNGEEIWMDDGSATGSNKVSAAQGAETAATNSIYELLEGNTPGYFKVHPVANNSGTQYNLKIETGNEGGDPAKPEHDYVILKSGSDFTEFTFGLSEELVKPYYDRAGYVGGLNATGKAAYEAADGNLMELQKVVYNPANIVPFTPGYYRLHSPEDIEVEGLKINPVRYASGYTHKLELTGGAGSTPIPMHFYEVEGKSSQFNQLKSKDGLEYDKGYTASLATQGDIPIPAVEYDPASIFRVFYVPSEATPYDADHPNRVLMSTQGLYLKGERDFGDEEAKIPVVVRSAARMTDNVNNATPLFIMDIGGAIMLIHDDCVAGGRVNLKYLSYDQTDEDHIYDLKLTNNTHTDHAKWLMQPANHLGLRVTTHSGGDGGTYGGTTYNYTTFYAPFDVMLPDTVKSGDDITKIYHAALLDSKNSPWDPPRDLHPKSMGRYNIEANGCPSKLVDGKELFRTNDRFIPAGTPVLIAMHDNAGYVILTLPNSTPHPMNSPFTANTKRRPEDTNKDNLGERTNILTGQYLEQELSDMTSDERIFVFGLPYSGTMTPNWSTGEIEATLPLQDNAGMGFYLNANPNKEKGLSIGDWTRNNRYVYSNKVYYRYTPALPSPTRGDIQFVPVVFDFDEVEEEENGVKEMPVGDGCVYDLLGRKVATKQQVEEGTWRQNLRPGIYILNGRKIRL